MQRSGPALAKQYEKLTPRERLALVLEARARGDDAEVRRLWDTCPRKVYGAYDADFDVPYEAVSKIVLATCADLAAALAKVRMLVASSAMLAPLLQMGSLETAHKLAEEIYAEERARQREGADTPQGPRDVEQEESGGAVVLAEIEPITPERYCEQHLPKTWQRAQAVVNDCLGHFAATPAGIFAGLDRFTRQIFGMDAKTVLRAVMPPLLAEIEDLKVDQVRPNQVLAAEVEETLMQGWRKFVFGEGI